MTIALPDHYKYLLDPKNPRIIREAIKLYGIKEVAGKGNNQTILNWADEIGGVVGDWYDEDSDPWCALFIAVCLKRAGFDHPQGFDAIRALSYAKWGNPAAVPSLGDIFVINRKGGGHVGIYAGQDKTHFHILGANQSDQVNVQKFLMRSGLIVAVRRCPWKVAQPSTVKPIILPDGLGSVSTRQD